MTTTLKSLVAFLFTALFILSSVHCRPTATNIPGIGYPSFYNYENYFLLCFFLEEQDFVLFIMNKFM